MNLQNKIQAKINLENYAKKHPLKNSNKKIVIDRTNTQNCGILFIGEAPGWQENQQGIPFVGKAGKILNNWILDNEIKEYTIINTIPLIPLDENNKIRPPTNQEIEDFKPYTKELIEALQPKTIILLGNTAKKMMNLEILKNKWVFEDEQTKRLIGFIYHPAYYLRNGKNGNEDFADLMNQIKNIRSHQNASLQTT